MAYIVGSLGKTLNPKCECVCVYECVNEKQCKSVLDTNKVEQRNISAETFTIYHYVH